MLCLGIDGGGTKTAAVLIEADGNELGRGMGGPCNLAALDTETPRRSLSEAVTGAFQAAGLPLTTRLTAVVAGVAGYSAFQRRPAFLQHLQETVQAETYRLEPDYVIAYWGASRGEPGVVVIAGTGAVAYGRNAHGETYRADGLGYLLGDAGGGFSLGLQMLRHTAHCLQCSQPDALTQALLAHLNLTSLEEVIQWLYTDFHPARVAALIPLVETLAKAGNPVALSILHDAATALAHTTHQVIQTLHLPSDCPVYPLGGLWSLGDIFRVPFTHSAAGFSLSTPHHDPAYGAALLSQS